MCVCVCVSTVLVPYIWKPRGYFREHSKLERVLDGMSFLLHCFENKTLDIDTTLHLYKCRGTCFLT